MHLSRLYQINSILPSFFYSALSTAKVRSRLQHLMGTDVIRINDKRYIDKMYEKLEIEQEVINIWFIDTILNNLIHAH